MITMSVLARRGLFGVFAVTAAGGAAVAAVAVPGAISATAATDPCAASEVAKTIGSLATSTGTYLDAHPETNTALTTISQQQGGPQSLVALKTYFDANPQAADELKKLQAPLTTLSGRCKLPLTLPQLLGLMQTAQSQGGAVATAVPGSLPAGTPSAQTVGVPGAPAPAVPAPRPAPRLGTGPLPGPASTTAG